jgi:hypothetical protein
MGAVVGFVPKSELERARLIREARAIYESIFPDAEGPRQPKRGRSGGGDKSEDRDYADGADRRLAETPAVRRDIACRDSVRDEFREELNPSSGFALARDEF